MDLYSTGGVTFLTIIDNFSKFSQAIPISACSSVHVADALLQVISTLGLPHQITKDSGTKFDNDVIKEICALHNIHMHFSTPYNPNSNSPIERLHSTLSEIIRIQKMTNKDDTTETIMKYALIAYNNTIHSATNYTPHEVLFGHTASRNFLEIYYPKEFYQDYVIKHKMNTKAVQECIAAHMSKNKEAVIAKRNQNAEEIALKGPHLRSNRAHNNRRPLGSDEYEYLEGKCRTMNGNTQLCEMSNTASKRASEDCIISRIQHRTSNCTYAKMQINKSIVQRIKDNTWIIVLREETVIHIKCLAKSTYKKASECTSTVYNLQHLLETTQEISVTEEPYWTTMMATPSWTTLILYGLLIAVGVTRIISWRKSHAAKDTAVQYTEDTVGSCRVSFQLKEGGVTQAQHG
ncbi:uncharacterized protein LOC126974848 [Leptidea sinapis]|uniref:uncharacterized protein LOC126974848 n=1 Tax=Leptidea sinapis TaxID=189913 RepID=UPI0021C283AD|nr:uncharacterized protein LOC126974848 [Leptidea sinapis]